ncbi:hypothetical protein SAMN04487930_104154 [Cytophaga hutchinsonii ATCC 33406]|nr:hypothetical protein SAMN04487930_104154 [Cytophaga hutchinsonii ATCC 33406]
MHMELTPLIGLAVILISSFLISWKAYKALRSRGKQYAVFFAVMSFVVSCVLIWVALLFAWIVFGDGFSRR